MAIEQLLTDDGGDDHQAWPRSRRMGADASVEMTPLIDVTFLLLIFFMVTASLAAQQHAVVPEAVYGKGIDPSQCTIITLVQPETGPTRLLLGDARGERGDLEAVRAWVQRGLDQGRRSVIVQAEGRVPAEQTRKVYQVLAAMEGLKVHIGVRDKQ